MFMELGKGSTGPPKREIPPLILSQRRCSRVFSGRDGGSRRASRTTKAETTNDVGWVENGLRTMLAPFRCGKTTTIIRQALVGAAVSSAVLADVTEGRGWRGGGCEGQVRRFSSPDDRSMT